MSMVNNIDCKLAWFVIYMSAVNNIDRILTWFELWLIYHDCFLKLQFWIVFKYFHSSKKYLVKCMYKSSHFLWTIMFVSILWTLVFIYINIFWFTYMKTKSYFFYLYRIAIWGLKVWILSLIFFIQLSNRNTWLGMACISLIFDENLFLQFSILLFYILFPNLLAMHILWLSEFKFVPKGFCETCMHLPVDLFQ